MSAMTGADERSVAGARRGIRALPGTLAILLSGLVLISCAQHPAPPGGTVAFRSPGGGIWSAAAFLPQRITGNWQQAAAYTRGESHGCKAGGVVFSQNGAGQLSLRARLCLDGREVAVSGPLTMTGPGRFSVPGMGEWWVIWVDSGYRTLAIATPDGGFGFVLDRGGISADRLRAAAEIFDFNGYRRDRLRPF